MRPGQDPERWERGRERERERKIIYRGKYRKGIR